MQYVSLGYSPCPNDTFIFYAVIHGKIDTGDLRFREVLLDVETLNRRAMNADLDLTKLSCHAFGHLRGKYRLLRSGGALGRGCGPLVIAKKDCSMHDLRSGKMAIPGRLTTAYLLLQLFDPAFGAAHPGVQAMPFHRIIDAVADGEVDAGLIIHESRFTYPSYGLKEIIDLGRWWEHGTGLPVPLGCIAAKHSLGGALIRKIDGILRQSVQYALRNPAEPMGYIREHSQELSADVIRRHIDLYVNDFSVDIGDEGETAIKELLSRAEESGIVPRGY